MARSSFKLFFFCAVAWCAAASGLLRAQQSFQQADLKVVAPVISCEKLAGADVSAAVGAATHITSARAVTDARPAGYCAVAGYVEPTIRFEVRLPLTNWTQRYWQTGCGGLCGQLSIRLSDEGGCVPASHGELALASTDMGHNGGNDGAWGSSDYQLRVDFAYRGVHETAMVAKALIALYYGQQPRYSYFSGCSDGGREALMEAQRFPQDFNGITAGAAAMNFSTQNTFYHAWSVLANTGADGKFVLTTEQLPILHKAALAACDAVDGLKDGLISDPLHCTFDPAVTECKPGEDAKNCLSHAQVEVARKIYAGAQDAAGNKYVINGPLPGSELAWGGVLIPRAATGSFMSQQASLAVLKHLVYPVDPPASYTHADLQLTPESFKTTTQLHGLYDATDPDLTPFAAAGGKLILWHGLADQHISPVNTVAYYTAMQKLLGQQKTEAFSRLYLFPGGYHCGGGEGPFDFPLMAAIEAWVEKGQAPDALIAKQSAGAIAGRIAGVPGNGTGGAMMPPQGGTGGMQGEPVAMGPGGPMGEASVAAVNRTRPVYPYPYTAQYSGTGSVDEARNFVKGPARPIDPARLIWLGSGFYAAGYEQWCTGKGSALSCAPAAGK